MNKPLRMNLPLIIFLLAVTVAGCTEIPDAPPPAPVIETQDHQVNHLPAKLLSQHDLKITWPSARRGDPGGLPKNSIEAIRRSVELGIPLIEVDVRMNSQGTLFLFHDAVLKSENFVGLPVFAGRTPESLTDQELAALSLPERPDIRFTQLADAMKAIRSSHAALLLDVRHESPDLLRAIAALAKTRGVTDRILVQVQSAESVKQLHHDYKEIETVYTCKSRSDLPNAVALRPTVVKLDGWHDKVAIDMLHARDIRALIDISDSPRDGPEEWVKLFQAGADVIVTDHAGLMLRWLRMQH